MGKGWGAERAAEKWRPRVDVRLGCSETVGGRRAWQGVLWRGTPRERCVVRLRVGDGFMVCAVCGTDWVEAVVRLRESGLGLGVGGLSAAILTALNAV